MKLLFFLFTLTFYSSAYAEALSSVFNKDDSAIQYSYGLGKCEAGKILTNAVRRTGVDPLKAEYEVSCSPSDKDSDSINKLRRNLCSSTQNTVTCYTNSKTGFPSICLKGVNAYRRTMSPSERKLYGKGKYGIIKNVKDQGTTLPEVSFQGISVAGDNAMLGQPFGVTPYKDSWIMSQNGCRVTKASSSDIHPINKKPVIPYGKNECGEIVTKFLTPVKDSTCTSTDSRIYNFIESRTCIKLFPELLTQLNAGRKIYDPVKVEQESNDESFLRGPKATR